MWIRRAFFSWLFPAALVLPLWLLIGWGIFQTGGWAFLWVLFIAMPSVLIGEGIVAFLIRARASVRDTRAVSWQDVIVLSIWHGLTIAVGFFPNAFGWILAGAIVGFLLVFWSALQQLWRDSAAALQRAMDAAQAAADPGAAGETETAAGTARGQVFVISESPADQAGTGR